MRFNWLLALPLIVTAAISGVFLAQLVLNRGELARGGDSARAAWRRISTCNRSRNCPD